MGIKDLGLSYHHVLVRKQHACKTSVAEVFIEAIAGKRMAA
jgi:hypothetical protein